MVHSRKHLMFQKHIWAELKWSRKSKSICSQEAVKGIHSFAGAEVKICILNLEEEKAINFSTQLPHLQNAADIFASLQQLGRSLPSRLHGTCIQVTISWLAVSRSKASPRQQSWLEPWRWPSRPIWWVMPHGRLSSSLQKAGGSRWAPWRLLGRRFWRWQPSLCKSAKDTQTCPHQRGQMKDAWILCLHGRYACSFLVICRDTAATTRPLWLFEISMMSRIWIADNPRSTSSGIKAQAVANITLVPPIQGVSIYIRHYLQSCCLKTLLSLGRQWPKVSCRQVLQWYEAAGLAVFCPSVECCF